MTEYEVEPIRGLPGLLPPGEVIVWQGAPDWRALARTAFRTRLIAAYFGLLAAWAIGSALVLRSGFVGVALTVLLGATGLGLLHLLAWGSARTTIYTLTNRRIVLRIGIAVPKCINVPLRMIGSVDAATRGDGTGDIALTIAGPAKLGILALWPHARPWRITTPQPMLRAIPAAADVAAMIARACRAAQPTSQETASEAPARPAPAYAGAVAA